MRRKKTTTIIFHHSLADWSPAYMIEIWHKMKGWSGIGYAFVIRKDGTMEHGRDIDEVGAHAFGRNKTSIGICMEGDFRKYEPTLEQLNACAKIYHDACRRYSKSLKIQFHRKWPNPCPGRMLDRNDFLEVVKRADPFIVPRIYI